ncbi:7-carboxy-7-deazaguanine synthase QueE [Paraburkholderia sp. HD33-4]|uniref:7-carboxy-7-deazaguanine synthase QueE n=1 Tax=Paraburkholderia sp. HD33-4 TaxID=2883242 RepID=UPI002DD445F4|nr:7-carboxy-7-deazaguanine synthase QueE [Paraburkholderia sp. HD33-4]
MNELFESIQGEASFTGTPAFFVRLQGCPVGCPWCDTKHTWEIESRHEVAPAQMQAKTVDAPTFAVMDVHGLVDAASGSRAAHVVITGGEPCVHDLEPLTAALLATGRTVQVETSGTFDVRVADGTWVTVSPKFAMPGGLAVRGDALYRADEAKCVVGRARDIDTVLESVLPHLRPHVPVWLQPVSQSRTATTLCITEAARHGWRLSLQTHKFIGVR